MVRALVRKWVAIVLAVWKTAYLFRVCVCMYIYIYVYIYI